jgi:hypothetical protein
MEEETVHLDPPSPSSSPQDELLMKEDQMGDTEDDKSSAGSASKPKSSLKLRSKKRKKSTSPQNGADCESQTSQFSRTSSTCGYRESFGMI